MNDSNFFKLYLPAVSKVLTQNTKEEIFGPDGFIENEQHFKQVELFEQENFERFRDLFEPLALYVDAVNHNFEEIEGIPVTKYKERLYYIMRGYAEKFNVEI